MFRSQIIGNLGADAHIEHNNGRPFISFSVAHNDRSTGEDGTVKETIQWISCAMNGDGGKLLEFLKKGRAVYVEGRTTTKIYSSARERRMVAGVNLSVDHLELIGSQVDNVPSRLYDNNGNEHRVSKSYWIDEAEAKKILGKEKETTLHSLSMQQYKLTKPCWVEPVEKPSEPANTEQVEIF